VPGAPLALTDRFFDAVRWAGELHRHQSRKTTAVPYLAHLLAVCALVLEDDGDEDEAIAALLHDAVEDAGGAPVLAEIERRYGPAVAAVVEACSDTDRTPKPPWRERKAAFLGRLADGDLPPGTLRVVAADKLHNARSLLAAVRAEGDRALDHFNAGAADQRWYHRTVAEVIARRHPGRLADDLSAVVAELDEALGHADERAGRGSCHTSPA
jgi:(p)ppGpp synthase/HD superfamily hydrolase